MPSKKTSKKNINYPNDRDVIGNERIKFFLNPEQHELLVNNSNKKILLKGGFGTGKSLLLKLKALELAKQGFPVTFFI